MRRRRSGTAARFRAAAFLLAVGCLLPGLLPHGRLRVPPQVEELLTQTLAGEDHPDRVAYVRAACGLVGQVGYFWGGKSRATGWDGRWGWPRRVTAPGSDTTGCIRPFGLDCSGLTAWAAGTVRGEEGGLQVGEGVRAQFARSRPTQAPRPGDLAFFPDLSHVGIVLGRDGEGRVWVVHCSASRGGVVVTPAEVGFTLYGSPGFFHDRD